MKHSARISVPLGIVIILAGIVVLEAGMVISGYLYYRHLAEIIQNKHFLDNLATAPTSKPLFLSVESFNNPLTSIDQEVVVSGVTLPNTTVVAYSDIDEFIVQSDSVGNFQDTLVVNAESGLVRVTAYAENGDEKTLTFILTESGSTVLGRSISKEVGVPAKPIGSDLVPYTKTDKSSSPAPLSVTAPRSAIAVSPTPFSQKITLSQQTADFISDKTMLYKAEKLGLVRIATLLSSDHSDTVDFTLKKLQAVEAHQNAVIKRQAASGVIVGLEGGMITLVHPSGEELAVYFNSSTIVSIGNKIAVSTDQLSVGMRIAVIGVSVEDGLLASRIHIFPGKAADSLTKPITDPAAITPPAKVTLDPITPNPSITINLEPVQEQSRIIN